MDASAAHDRTETVLPLRVLICPDRPSWSFDNIANNISRYAGPNHVQKFYMQDVVGREHEFYETIFLNRIDLCHMFWREDMFYMLNPFTIDKAASRLGFTYEALVRAINSCAFTTSVYDHLFSAPDEMQTRRASFAMVDGYTVCSRKLHAIYSAEPGVPRPDAIITDGVDVDHFSPAAAARGGGGRQALGWVGNSAWGQKHQGYDVKGFHRLFQPMLADLGARGFAVEPKVADPQIEHIAFSDMPGFYRGLDLFICTSAIEGTPNPVLEAMACGIPVISTDVGIVADVFGHLQKRFLLRNPTVQSLSDAAAELLSDEALRLAIGAENRSRALEWSWQAKTADWWPFWQAALKRASDPRNAARRESYLIAQAAIL